MTLSSKLLLRFCLFAVLWTCGGNVSIHAETFRNPYRIPLPVDPYGVTTGDLNGDGRNDIVWTELPGYPGPASLHVLLATASGQYTSAPDLALPFYPQFVQCIVEDVTGDKINDIVCAANSATTYASVYLITYIGKGDGSFGAPLQTLASQYGSDGPLLARSGDLNGDGRLDVIFMAGYTSAIWPFLSDGKGGFVPAPASQGSFNYSIPTIADVNGDGKLDVLWPTGPRVDLGHGDGTFAPVVQYDPGYNSNCAFGDVDHDGHLDAACVWYDTANGNGFITLAVLHGNPDGSFNTTPLFTRTFGNGVTAGGGYSTIIAPVLVADLNGDGYADIVSLSGDGYCVLLGGPNSTWSGRPQQFVSASWQSQGGLAGIYGVSIADMNGDTLPDIVAIGPNGLYITYAQKDGTLSSAPAYEVGQLSTSATLADFNGDGNLDVVSAGDTALNLNLGLGDGTFSSPQPITTVDNFGEANYIKPTVMSGDFNGDGKQDLIATGSTAPYTSQTYILFGHGDGTFTTPSPIALTTLGKVADLNNDGKSDMVFVQNNTATIPVDTLVANLSHGDGTFTTVSSGLPVEIVSGGFIASFAGPALADFRHSGNLDAAIATENNAYLIRGNGDGTFTSMGTPLPIPNLTGLNKTGTIDIAIGDFDGDGNPDFAVMAEYGSGAYNVSTPTSAAWVFYGKGDGTFSSAVLAGTFNRDAQTMTAGDLNGDGLADLVLTSYSGSQDNGVLIVHSLRNRTWGPEFDYTGGEGLSPVWITDINHDGRNDLVFSNAGRLNYISDSVSVLLNLGGVTVSGTVTATPEPSNVTYPFSLQANLIPSNPSDVLTGTVVFSIDGTVVGTAALAGNTAVTGLLGASLAAGSHALSASWAGNSTYPAVTLSGTHTVTLLPLTLSLAATPTSVVSGGTVVAATTLTLGLSPLQTNYQFTGALTLYDNGISIAQQQVSRAGSGFTLPSLAVGTHTLKTAYSGDSLFAAALSNAVTVTVTGAPSTATLSAAPATGTYGTPITLTAKIAPSSPSIPTGTVTFTVDGAALAPVALSSAVGTTILSNLAVGTHSVSCAYSGDGTFAPSTCNTVQVVITPGTSAITIASSQNPSIAYTPVTFTIHLTLNGQPAPAGTPFTFSLMGNSSNVSLLTDATGSGTYTTSQLFARTWNTDAIFSGNNYVASIANYAQVVTAAATSLTLAATPNPAYTGQTVAFTANATPSGTTFPTGNVTFSDGGAVLGAGALNSAGQAVYSSSTLAVGTHTISASYAGDQGFADANSQGVNEVILPSGFTIALAPASLSIQAGASGTALVQLGSVGNFAGPLQLTVASPPTYASTKLSASTVSLTAGGTASSTLSIQTLAIASLEQSKRPGTIFGVLPASLAGLLLCSLLPAGKAASRLRRTLLLVLAGLTLGSSTGCLNSWYAVNAVAAGVYSLPVTATDMTGRTQTATLTLTVTPSP